MGVYGRRSKANFNWIIKALQGNYFELLEICMREVLSIAIFMQTIFSSPMIGNLSSTILEDPTFEVRRLKNLLLFLISLLS